MIASLKGYGRIARALLGALGALLVIGIAGSLLMSVHARHSAQDQIVHQAQTIADSSLTLAFTPADLAAPVSAERATQLTSQIQAIVIDPSDFDSVTLFSPEGTILYSTATSRIGTQLPGEKDSLKDALRGIPVTSDFDGTLSVELPLRFRSGLGGPAVVQLTHPDSTIASAAGPWRTNAMFLFALLVLLGVAVFGVARLLSVVANTGETRPAETPRPMTIMPARQAAPHPGLREEGEARRRAEERARAAEERLTLLQDQYRTTLEELQAFQELAREPRPSTKADTRMEERALRAEGQVQELQQQLQTITKERERLATELQETIHAAASASGSSSDDQDLRLREAELEAIGLNAELDVTKEQLDATRRELASLRASAGRSTKVQEELDAAAIEVLQVRDTLTGTQSQLARAQQELDDAHSELRALRNEEQRAAMLEDELRAARAEVESIRASHKADLVEREADLEEKVRSTREEFQRQLDEIEASYREQLNKREADLGGRITDAESSARAATDEVTTAREEVAAARAEAASREQQLLDAHDEIARLREQLKGHESEVKERSVAVGQARKESDDMRRSLTALQEDLARADATIEEMRGELESERLRNAENEDVTLKSERDRAAQQARAEKLVRQLEDAAAENADLNRRLQDFEARRQLELADDQGRAQIDQLLRVTQERLAGQTEKLIAAEDRVKDLETDLTTARERVEVVEGDLRMHQMSDALRETREPEGAADMVAHEPPTLDAEAPAEDRRATTPFMKELSVDAKRSIAKINGITQLLKHKKDGKDQAQLIKQLTTHARKLDHTVADLADAERLVSGSIELNIRRTDLESLVARVVEEAAADSDHDVRVVTEPVKARVDPVRVEQILNGMLRTSSERTQSGKTIVVRLQQTDGGAQLSVEDPETSSDASISPIVRRLTEVLGGTIKAESRDGGGSAFRVTFPDGEPGLRTASAPSPDVKIVVDETSEPAAPATAPVAAQDEPWEAEAAHQQLAAELRRLAELQDK